MIVGQNLWPDIQLQHASVTIKILASKPDSCIPIMPVHLQPYNLCLESAGALLLRKTYWYAHVPNAQLLTFVKYGVDVNSPVFNVLVLLQVQNRSHTFIFEESLNVILALWL
jgi:hypothetical protein